uniref:Cation-transporting ATPase n=1 Tax=Aceria tosichella TaxID=561515 RepID=A0A6G1SQ57_9ACAR
MEIYGYKRSYFNTFLTWILIIGTGFLLRLMFYWKPHWMLYATYRRCRLSEAERVLLIDKYNQCFVEKVQYLYGVPHPSTLAPKDTNDYPDDDDEILICPDDVDDNGQHRYGKQQYGSLAAREISVAARLALARSRHRTQSTRSNKSGVTTENADSESEDEKDDSDRLSMSQEKELDDGANFASNHNMDKEHDFEGSEVIRYFENKKIRYVWYDDESNFIKLRGFDKNMTFSGLQKMTSGLSVEDQARRRRLFGDNRIHIEVLPYMKILFQEVLGPFYIFQVFSCAIWFVDDYYYYGTCIIVMSVASLVSSVIQIRRNQEQLRDTVVSTSFVKVCRGKDIYEEIDSGQLVPGDIVVVPTFNSLLQFDGILINGNVIVNESMLTGESVPVTKTPLPVQNQSRNSKREIYYDEKEHSKHTLFCGTKVLQTRYYGGAHVKALVIRVGFQTAKGELIRSIMFPKPVDFRFNKQIHKFIGVLGCMALIGFLYSVVLKSHRGADLKTILISALDLITIVVPPALPAAMTIGIIYAQSRLKNNKIFCISPRSINISGCIDCVCFDKTGTLTEDNLSFNEVVPLIESKCQFGRPFDEDVMQTSSKQVERDHHLLLDNGEYSPLMMCLASCHSLTIIDHKIIGDPLDLQMFEATGWVLEEPDVDDENKFDLLAPTVVRPPRRKRRTPLEAEIYASSSEFPSSSSNTEDELDVVSINTTQKCQRDVGILRQFPFSSSLQRMSVVTRQFSGSQYVVYAKGAPEKIASLCDPKTIPEDFNEVLHDYTHKGFRVLALAYRPLKAGLSYTRMQRASRSEIEKDLRFLGLLTLGNLLKPETIPVIATLSKAAIRCIMVTGDNMLTAVSVANECGMISSHDKTVVVEVEKESRKSSGPVTPMPSKENLPAQFDHDTAANEEKNLVTVDESQNPMEARVNSLVLSVETIELQSRTESEPILVQKRTKEQTRPKLTWRYVSSTSKQDSGYESTGGDVNPMVRLEMFDDAKIHLALTGETWDVVLKHYPELLNPICVRGTVFARMSPHQKQQLVEQLQSLQYYVGMCGDGANDSGALRSAHAGISLSDTEASVAAPFTSANANISCVPILISEGRAALVTAFGILKYMALYSMIQFCSVLLLYTMYTNFTDTEFLYEDLFIIATFVAVFGRTGPSPTLANKPPPSSLLSVTQLASVMIQLALVIFFQILSLVLLWQNSWYQPHPDNYDHDLAGHDNFAIFAMSSFQCISLAVVFSKGKPYRRSILSNYLFTGALLVITCSTITLIIIKSEWNMPFDISLDVKGVTLEFRLLMIALVFTHFALAMLSEKYIVDHLIFKKSGKFLELFGMKPKCSLFQAIDLKTRSSLNWLIGSTKEGNINGHT